MDDLSRFCCLNPDCPDHGKRGHGNLTVPMRYGPNKSRRLLRCSTCKARFSERKGTPLFDARLPAGTVNRECCSWRALPHDFPHWKTVYNFVRAFEADGTWDRLVAALRVAVRTRLGRDPTPSG